MNKNLIRSEIFYAAYASGEEPEHDEWVLDFGEWASVSQTWLVRQVKYRNEIQRRQQQPISLLDSFTLHTTHPI